MDNDIWKILLTSKESEVGIRRLMPYGNTALMWAIANGEFPVAEELISLIIEKNMQQCFLIQSVPDQRSFEEDAFTVNFEIGKEKSTEIWQELRKADILNKDNLLTTDLGSCSPTEYNEIYDKVSKCLGSENQQYISYINGILGFLSVKNNPLHLIIAKGYESIFWSNSASYTNLSITILNSLNDNQAHDIARQKNRYGYTPLHLQMLTPLKVLKSQHFFHCLSAVGQRTLNGDRQTPHRI